MTRTRDFLWEGSNLRAESECPRLACFLNIAHAELSSVKRATMHWLIAAKNGNKNVLECLQSCFKKGFASIAKQDFETAIRAYYEMRKTMKSEQREAAAAAGYC